MLQAIDLAKSFGPPKARTLAVDGASFKAEDGQITTLLGANGSGKSTTLGILIGLLKPDRGQALVDGADAGTEPKAARERLGWVPDAFGLYPRLTVREHLRYFGRLHGLQGAGLEDAIDRTIADLEMADIADRRTEGFSTGQRIRVALARAVVHGPRNLILDEPSRGLDVMGVRALRESLKRLRADGRCILMSSHVMADVMELSDRVVCIVAGRVVAEGSPADLIRRTEAPDLETAFIRIATGAETALAAA